MTKITVDQALIEQAAAAINLAQDNLRPHGDNCFLHEDGEYNSCFCGLDSLTQHLLTVTEALAMSLAEPAVEPFGYFRAEPFGWTDCAPTDEGAKALYEVPTPAEPAVEPACKPALQVHKPTGWVAHRDQYTVPVLFNPYTGEPRDVRDVQSDPQGVLIVPPGKVDMIAASPPPPAEPAPVPLLTDDEVKVAMHRALPSMSYASEAAFMDGVRVGEQLVRRKAGL